MTQRSFTHSGTLGDVVSSLVIVKILGGGDFYLKMNNMDNMVLEKLGWPGAGIHSGRMTEKDYNVLEPLIKSQSYIHSFQKWNGEQVTNEFEEVCRHHQAGGLKPRNFANQYASSQGIDANLYKEQLQQQSWLECENPIKVPNRPIVIARNTHYLDGAPTLNPTWQNWFNSGLANRCVYIGLDHEHAWFEDLFKVTVPHYKTEDMLQMTRVIAGSELFIGNQSSPCGIAIALGKTSWFETRKNETLDNNEIYYPFRINIQYF
jgi:hypothetical protein